MVANECKCCPESRKSKAKPVTPKSFEQLKAENPGCAVVLVRSGMGHGPAMYKVVRRGVSR